MVKNISRIVLNATPERVWDALTNPLQVKLWQYGSDLITTWQVGQPIRFRAAWQDQVFEQWGTVLEYTAPVRLRYSLFAPREDLEDKPEHSFEMVYELAPQGHGVELTITQEDGRPGAVAEADPGEPNPVLVALKALVEG